MKMKTSKQIRKEFIRFFENKDHSFVPSSPVIPFEDPTLLFINAGMNQFKDVFLGIGNRPYSRAVNSQKCIRVSGKHNDLEEVGHDTYHHTFFEMLGNWSFGDYYKKETIQWAWELLTKVWNLPRKELWATVFREDDEAETFWQNETDIEKDHILRFDEKDNFWEMAETGPCGPSSEIHIDLGSTFCDKKNVKNHVCGVNGGCRRFIELWNLVFIQYNRDENRQLHTLPQKHIDTGMGFERIVSVLQKVPSNYKTDLFIPIIESIENISKYRYNEKDETISAAYQVIADHLRMLTFAIGDGAFPTNEGRGYVLRRILRRAARYGRKLDLHEPFIYKLVPVLVDIMGDTYTEIKERKEHIMEVIKAEEVNFNKTLDRGIDIFESIANRIKIQKEKSIPGEEIFRLYDTFGFPIDLTRVMASEKGLLIDEEGFDREMEIQRERARNSGKFATQFNHMDNWRVLKHCPTNSRFVGYEKFESETHICKFARSNGNVQIVLTETPFYPESGGQVSDRGIILVDNFELKVIDVQRESGEIIHICKGPKDLEIVHSNVIAKVDRNLRLPTMYNHTATHLLHSALRKVLGSQVQQAGSLVEPERLRFDFTHFKKIEQEELLEIERLVNEQIRANKSLKFLYTNYNQARKMGAIALFGEKYGEEVRVVSIENFSEELCGGTHVESTGQIGAFFITHESSISSGIRRIEAVTGPNAIIFLQNSRKILSKVSQELNVPLDEISEKVRNLNDQVREYEKKWNKVQTSQILNQIDTIVQNSRRIGKHIFAVQRYEHVDLDLLKQVADQFRNKVDSGIILLISILDDKINFVCAVTENLIKEGVNAAELVREVAKITGGGGGGRPHLATAGGKDQAKLEKAIQTLEKKIKILDEIK